MRRMQASELTNCFLIDLQVIIESNQSSKYLIPVFGTVKNTAEMFTISEKPELLPSATPDKSISINISGANVETITYMDSMAEMKLPENPSFSYPKGHYLPIPFSLFELIADGNLFVEWIPDN